MRSKHSLPHLAATTAHARSITVGAWRADLLPKDAYEARYTPQLPVIGFAFEAQAGVHAIGTSRTSDFKAYTNALAYVPPGCDVFSKSDHGGEYLSIACRSRPSRLRGIDRKFSNMVDGTAVAAAHKLRKLLLSGTNIDTLYAEQLLVTLTSRAEHFVGCGPALHQTNGWMTARRSKLVLDLIEARLESKLTIQELAAAVGLSIGFFSRAFKATMGTAPQYYIIERRIARARSLMRETDWDLSEISQASGFASHAHMTATFQARLGAPPCQLRNYQA
jgi:AraC family transcriptional regulator